MHVNILMGFMNLFCVGLLAGEEFTIRYGVRSAVASLADQPHIQLRQTLIRKLRILVPAVFALALLSGGAVTILFGFDHGFGFRCAGLLALLSFITVTLTGTVPINQAALAWDPTALPKNWETLLKRWEQLDTARCWAAMAAFALFLVAMMLQ